MASSKGSSSPSMPLIVALIFFVLGTFIAGTVAYFGYADQETMKKQVADAKKASDASDGLYQDMQAKYIVLALAIGVATEDDIKSFAGLMEKRSALINDEKNKIVTAINAQLKEQNKTLDWITNGGAPAPAPEKTIVALIKDSSNLASTAAKAKADAEAAKLAAETTRDQIATTQKKDKAAYDAKVEELNLEIKKLADANKAAFDTFQVKLNELGKEISQHLGTIADNDTANQRKLAEIDKTIADFKLKISRYEQTFIQTPDLLKADVAKGIVEKRDESYVYLSIGSASYLRPGVTFAILPKDASWRNTDEKDRLTKGQIEVVEILGPHSSRAKIIGETNPIRDPIRVKDQLFNAVWVPGTREHVAFAGIIDLNGDGLDDDKAFISMLEKQGVVIDEWLDLTDRTIKGKGMTIATKFLVLGPDVDFDSASFQKLGENDPRAAARMEIQQKMGSMKLQAGKLGIQVIDYRKFLISVGHKLPQKMFKPSYGTVDTNRGAEPPPPKGGGDNDLSPDPKDKDKDPGK